MVISLENIGKRFNKEWIFRNISCTFSIGNKYSILGTNGSGKSTLLQIIAGAISQTEGHLSLTPRLPTKKLTKDGGQVSTLLRQSASSLRRSWLRGGDAQRREGEGTNNNHSSLPPSGEAGRGHLSYAAPYLELPEEMTWKEAVVFHGKFKKYVSGFTPQKIIELSELVTSSEKEIRNFSSGMKQRARLTLAILSDTPLLLLDEPSTNLDEHAVKWYQNLIAEFAKEKLVIVCSNYNKEEYSFCNEEFILKKN